MEFSVPGFIKRYCQPNAMLTLAEYLEDYAPEDTREKGYILIRKKLNEIGQDSFRQDLIKKLEQIKEGKRDVYL